MDEAKDSIGKSFRVDTDPEKPPSLGLDRPYDGNYYINESQALRFIATMPGGLEEMSAKELEKKFEGDIKIRQGKIHFEGSVECFSKMHTLRSVDNLALTIADVEFDWDQELYIIQFFL